ncbi:Sacsin-like 2, partial [Homarus americanus]
GPALCLFNNSNFTKEDWHGIRKLSDSIKKDDPLKVGQFGLGFKSILSQFSVVIKCSLWIQVSQKSTCVASYL